MKPYALVLISIVAGILIAFVNWDLDREKSENVPSVVAEDVARHEVQTIIEPDLLQNVQFVPTVSASSENHENVHDAIVEFPNGDTVNVTLTLYVPPPPPLNPTGRLMDVYDKLKHDAEEGDAVAARTLHRGIKNCRFAIVKPSLQKALSRLKNEQIFIMSDGHEVTVLSSNVATAAAVLRSQYHECEGIREEHTMNNVHWAKIASDGSDLLGMRDYMATLGDADPERIRILSKMWKDGYVEALLGQSMYYIFSQNGQPNNVRNYAYYLAFTEILESTWEVTDNLREQAMRLAAMRDVLSQQAAALSPVEEAEAEALAVQIVRDNPKCCLSSWKPNQ